MAINKKTILNWIYLIGVACVIILVTYAIYCNHGFWSNSWNGRYSSIFMPFIFNAYALGALAVGAIPMTAVCILVYKQNKISKSKYKFVKFNLIFLPSYLCIICLWALLHEVMAFYTFQNF